MNNRKLIDSGVLEQYVLGELPEAEMNRLYALIQADSELKQEVNRLELDLEQLYTKASVKAPAVVKENLLVSLPEKSNEQVPVKPVHLSAFWPAMAAAGVVLSIILGYLLVTQRQELEFYKNTVASLNAEKEVLAGRLDKASFQNGILLENGTRVIPISGENGKAKVIWNTVSGKTLFVAESLPALADDQDYQLWAIKGDQKIDAGVFHAAGEPVQTLNVEQADAFAVTIEPKGGSRVPTLEKLILVGAVAP